MEEALNRLESMRRKLMRIFLIAFLLIGAAVLLFFMVPLFSVILLAAAVILLTAAWGSIGRKYKAAFKKEFVEEILRMYFTDLVFDPGRGLSRQVIADTNMMSMGNRYRSDDYICGKYKGIPFEQADVCIQQVTSNGKSSSTTTYFEGRWMIFFFNKDFQWDLQVREKGFAYAKKSGGWFSGKPKMHGIQMENMRFEEAFDVYCMNDHEAYYILTPHIMQSMIELKEQTEGRLLLCFVGGFLHVAVNSGHNAFEPPVFRRINGEELRNGTMHDISMITRFVDALRLDRNLFKG